MSTPAKIWKPTQAQCKIIKAAAALESGMKTDKIKLEPGLRLNKEDDCVESSINIARVTRRTDGKWWDTDLEELLDWTTFKKGVALTGDGRAIVDFYIYGYGVDKDLQGNILVFFENNQLSSIRGYSVHEHLRK